MNDLQPWLSEKLRKRATTFDDLEYLDKEDIPEAPGVYIMLSENTEYIYPRGKSRAFYIGSSTNLRRRLWGDHRKYYLEARDDPRYDYYWSRYEYPAAHGCRVCWVVCRDAHSAKDLEKNLLIDFADYYKAKPVANNQGAWRSRWPAPGRGELRLY